MKFKNFLMTIATLSLLCSPAYAGDRPEFDCVGDDTANFFNDQIKALVIAENPWNAESAFVNEFFNAPVQLTPDICFPGYDSAYTQWRRPARYEWQIVLQMDPQSDLDLNIVDCVVKHNSKTAFGSGPWEGADQTGRYQTNDGVPFFIPAANPMVTVEAIPGPNAVFGFETPFFLTNRSQGGLAELPFVDLLYTSKALWEEGLVARMPEHMIAAPGDTVEYPLSAGDILNVKINIPFLNSVDLRYGSDNVCIKYVGIDGTIFTQAAAVPQ